MIWKILSGVSIAILLFVLLAWLVPDLRKWLKQQTGTNQELTDSLRTERTRRLRTEAESIRLKASQDRAEMAYQQSLAKQNAIVPQIKLEVSGLSAMQQRLAILESLIAQGLLKPADTTVKTPAVSYNLPEQTALAVQLRICDSLKAHNFYVERKIATLSEAYRLRGDSMSLLHGCVEEGKTIADQKRLFTGRNKRLRLHSREPPVFR